MLVTKYTVDQFGTEIEQWTKEMTETEWENFEEIEDRQHFYITSSASYQGDPRWTAADLDHADEILESNFFGQI